MGYLKYCAKQFQIKGNEEHIELKVIELIRVRQRGDWQEGIGWMGSVRKDRAGQGGAR